MPMTTPSSPNYIAIIARAAKITWQNKFLWLFGFFLVLGGSGHFYVNSSAPEKYSGGYDVQNTLEEFFAQQETTFLVALGGVVLSIAVALCIAAIFARAGLILSVNRIERGEHPFLGDVLRASRPFFWRLFFLSAIAILSLFAVAVTLFLPIGFLFSAHATVLGIIGALFALLIFIPLVVLVHFLVLYARLYIVIGNLRVRSALERSYALFRKNIGKSFLFTLLLFVANLVIFCATLFILLIIFLPLLFLGFVCYLLFQQIGAIVVALVGIIILLGGFLLIRSIFETFCSTAWVLFFRVIARTPEEPVVVTSVASVKIPDIEQKSLTENA